MRLVLLFSCLAACGLGQVSFEVASIKPAPAQEMGHLSVSMSTDKGRLSYSNVSFYDLIGEAYHVKERQISGPDWLGTTRFDIVAKLPEGSNEKQIPEMLKALLAERFALKAHEETKEMAIYALTVGKNGPKLKKTESDDNSIDTNGKNARMHMTAKTTMANFAEHLSGAMDRPVVDQTGLSGAFEFELNWMREGVDAVDADAPPSIFTAVQEQLGLRLAAMKGPVRQIVVDRIDRTPMEN